MAKKTHHPTLSQPPKNLTDSAAALKAEVNATKTALATEVALKLGGGATVDATLPRFTGDVTCYVDDATGDVVGLQLGSSAPLCSTAGTPRSFAVPTDGYIADVKVAVDKATGLVGGLTFVVKTNDSALIPTNIVTCGTRGGVSVSIMPKLAALAGVTATCKPAQSGPQAALGLVLDPTALTVAATTVNAPSISYAYVTDFNGGAVYACTGVGTGALACTAATASGVTPNPFGIAVSGSYVYVTDFLGGTVNACTGVGTGALTCAPATLSGAIPNAYAIAVS